MERDEPDEVTRVIEPSPSRDTITAESTGVAIDPEVLPSGHSFGRYVVVRPIGQGGMGAVYLAYDPHLDRGVALKVLRPSRRASEQDQHQDQARLLREAQAMARLSHPNVLPVYDVGTVGSHVFVAMEYVDGPTLGRWMHETERPWSAVVTIFMEAGRGLAAAHAADLVHRDFKPDNVLLDEHARPRVMDFGLARVTIGEDIEASYSSPSLSEMSLPSASGSGSISTSITRTGVVLGTPAYMAPEQHLGAAPDPASDQFSFCVALYEALYGSRPFVGRNASEICRATLKRELRPAPPHSSVPGWLRTVVVRGLAPDPAERWPTIDALLAALERHRREPRPWWVGAAVLGALGMLGGASVWWGTPASDPCASAESILAETWGDDNRRAVYDVFVQTGLTFAGVTAEHTLARIEAWGDEWTREHRAACEATHVRHEQSEAVLDLRMRCLDGRRRELESLTDVLATAERNTVEHAVAVVEHLPRPSYCADVEALEAEVPPPESPAMRQRVQRLRAALARVDALIVSARFEDARRELDRIRSDAADVDYGPVRVELGLREARVLESEGAVDDAIEQLNATLWRAESLRLDRVAVSIATDLVGLDGAARNAHERGELWAALALAKLERVGDSPRLLASLHRRRGDLEDARGHYDEAARHYSAALELQRTHAPSSEAYARALGDYGKIHFRAGRVAEALAHFQQAQLALAEALGPDHPDVAKLMGNAATAYHLQGDYERARESFESVLRQLERAYGPDHLTIATALTNLGSVYYRQGHYAEAIEAGRRAIRIKDATLGPGHAKTGINLNNIGMALNKQGQPALALATFQRAEAALATMGSDHIALVEPLIGQGEQLLHMARPADAIVPLERAYALERQHDHAPERRALPAFLLAQALWDSGTDRARARVLSRDASDVLGASPETPEDQRLAHAIRVWRAKHPAN